MGVPSRLEKNAYEIAMSKNANDPLLGGLSGKKNNKNGGGRNQRRRKLFPAKPSSKNRRNSSLNGEGGLPSVKVKMGVANFSSLHSAGEKRNGRSYSTLMPTFSASPRDISTFEPSFLQSFEAWLPQELTASGTLGSKISSPNRSTLPQIFARQRRNITGVVPRTAHKPHTMPANVIQSIPYAQSNAKRLGYRGRIVAAGLAVAACFLNPTSATMDANSKALPFWKKSNTNLSKRNSCNLEPWNFPRGGDFEDSSSVDGFLPPQLSAPPIEFAHGTTTLSFAFKGGIIAAVDSRASLGQFVGSKTTQKVLPVGSHILGTMAGGAADCQHWIRKLKSEALLHELTEEGRRMSVARASRILSNYMYALRGYDLSVGTMIMGFDDTDEEKESPPCIYYVDNTGLRIQGDMFSVGSGSTFALGILDSQEDRFNLSSEDAIALGIRAIRHATFRDAYSGGYINVFLITPKDGWKKVYTEDIARSPEAWKAKEKEMTKALE
mmetsp:Transcript_19471/g.40046  ORF Transcript_19471/g.40046 Transcript_19471/m.40046 type:complete len:495 (+) Transcript_19471:168-1652(+)